MGPSAGTGSAHGDRQFGTAFGEQVRETKRKLLEFLQLDKCNSTGRTDATTARARGRVCSGSTSSAHGHPQCVVFGAS